MGPAGGTGGLSTSGICAWITGGQASNATRPESRMSLPRYNSSPPAKGIRPKESRAGATAVTTPSAGADPWPLGPDLTGATQTPMPEGYVPFVGDEGGTLL